MRPACTAERGQARIFNLNGFGHFEKAHIFRIGTRASPLRYNESEPHQSAGRCAFFFARKIGLFSLRAVLKVVSYTSILFFVIFPSLSKKNRCWVSLAAVLNFGYFELILFRDQASYRELIISC